LSPFKHYMGQFDQRVCNYIRYFIFYYSANFLQAQETICLIIYNHLFISFIYFRQL